VPGGRFRRGEHRVEVVFDDFGWEALSQEARLQGVSVEELVYHAAIYYLARIHPELARRPPRPPEPQPDEEE
jgi:hypothetical protein